MRMEAITFLLGINLAMLGAHAALHYLSEVARGDSVDDSVSQGQSQGETTVVSVSGVVTRRSSSSSAIANTLSSSTSTSASTSMLREEGMKKREMGETKESTSTSTSTSKQCPLCMDQVTNPAAPQCGHIFCWDCIHTWVNTHTTDRTHSGSSGSGSGDIKCPVCRCLFKRKAVRALFNFS